MSRSPLAPLTDWLLVLVASEPDLTLDAIAKRLFAAHEMKTSEFGGPLLRPPQDQFQKKACAPANNNDQT